MFSSEILSQHVAVLGKTGSGKTSTAKLMIEQVVAEGARVCVLDPIKSDWWGLTSSADGKKAGLPFHILGGPRGHVPLHASAGKAIAEIVANGSLPLSVIDMAEFEPGGQQKFFKDFAPALLRKMRGIVYLVIEEAHMFAPKERSGFGDENMAIHWAKTLATAGRSKGIRLILATQRVQALHNALLGSCDTMVVHRLTAPADQEPAVKWLKANTSKEIMEQVSSSLSSLKTGQGWICSGEAKQFEVVQFPRIHTYDNTATPTSNGDVREVKTVADDRDKLTAIIGEAVQQAIAEDPKELKKQLAAARAELSKRAVPADRVEAKTVSAITNADRELLSKINAQINAVGHSLEIDEAILTGDRLNSLIKKSVELVVADIREDVERRRAAFLKALDGKRLDNLRTKLQNVSAPAAPNVTRPVSAPGRHSSHPSNGSSLPPGELAVLKAAAQWPEEGVTRDQLGVLTGYKRSSRDAYIARMLQKGFVTVNNRGNVFATEAGIAALGSDYEPLPIGAELYEWWRGRLPSGELKMLDVLVAAEGKPVARETLDQETGFARSSRDAYLSRLASRRLVENVGRGEVRASAELFS